MRVASDKMNRLETRVKGINYSDMGEQGKTDLSVEEIRANNLRFSIDDTYIQYHSL